VVADHGGFSVFKLLDFEEAVAPLPLIGRFRVLKHHTFALGTQYLVHQGSQMFLVVADCLLEHQYDVRWLFLEGLLKHCQTMLEGASD